MFQFFLGFVSGIYIGTHYECKPFINKMVDFLKNYFPEKKN